MLLGCEQDSENDQLILQLTVNLLSRLYPALGIVYLGDSIKCQGIRDELILSSKCINPEIEILDETTVFSIAICIGATGIGTLKNIYVTADSWNLEIRINQPIEILIDKSNFNPFSASAVACFAVAEVFSSVFDDLLFKTEKQSQGFLLSLLDYSNKPVSKESIPSIHFNDLSLVGLGAIGNAVIWCIEKLPEITGNIILIDHEQIDLSNLQRYVLAQHDNIGDSKVGLAKEYLNRDGLNIQDFSVNFGDYVANYRPDCNFDVIGIAVDNAVDRIAAQTVLPKRILNAWTGDLGALGISRHYFDSAQACLACLYLSTKSKLSHTEEISKVVGFDPRETADMVVNRVPLTLDLIQRISSNKGYPIDLLEQWEGKTLEDFYLEAICGGILLKSGVGETIEEEALVPLVHQSVLAGVILACEIVKQELNLVQEDLPVEIRMNVLTNLPEYICTRRGKTTKPQCICLDSDYLEVFHEKYH